MTFYWKDLSIELNSNFSKKVPRISRYRLDDNKFQHFQKGTLAEETLGEWLSTPLREWFMQNNALSNTPILFRGTRLNFYSVHFYRHFLKFDRNGKYIDPMWRNF